MRRRLLLPGFLLLALPVRGDLWVDPPPGTPLDWRSTEGYAVGPPEKPAYEVGGAPGNPAWEEAETPDGRTRALAKHLRYPRPSRVRTVDIWGEWEVARLQGGYDYVDGSRASPKEEHRRTILARCFARKEMPYFLPEAEFARHLVELGDAAVEPCIACLSDAALKNGVHRALRAITGKDLPAAPGAWEHWFTRSAGVPPRPAAKEEAGDLGALFGSWVEEELARDGWGLDPDFGAALTLYAEQALPAALKAARSGTPSVRRAAVGWLGTRPEPEARKALLEAAGHEDPVTAFRALRGLVELQDPEGMGRNLKDLGSKDPLRRAGALHAVGFSGDVRHANALEGALSDPDLESTALVALARLGDRGQRARFQRLSRQSGKGKAAFQAQVAAAALARMGEEEGARKLAEVFKDVSEKRITCEVAGMADPTWPYPEQVPTFRIFLVDLVGRSPQRDWQDILRRLAMDAAADEELRGVALQGLVLAPGDPFLDTLESFLGSAGVPPFARACAFLRLHEADPARALQAVRKTLWKTLEGLRAPPSLEEAVRASQDQNFQEVWKGIQELEQERLRLEKRGKLPERRVELAAQIARMRLLLSAALNLLPPQEHARAHVEGRVAMAALSKDWPTSKSQQQARMTEMARLQGLLGVISACSPAETSEPLLDAALSAMRLTPAAEDGALVAELARPLVLSESLRIRALEFLACPERKAQAEAVLAVAADAKTPSRVRQAAALAVARQGDPAAAKALVPLLEDPDGWVRVAAYVALRRLTGEELFCDWLNASLPKRQKAAELWRASLP